MDRRMDYGLILLQDRREDRERSRSRERRYSHRDDDRRVSDVFPLENAAPACSLVKAVICWLEECRHPVIEPECGMVLRTWILRMA